jgi:predicted acylesterase/phospholipase RssA
MVATPKKRISRKKKLALVLSGGGTKAAAFHIGVAYALREKGFSFYQGLKTDQNRIEPHSKMIQTYIGSSGGSFIATVLAAGYSLENISASFLNQSPSKDSEFFPRPLPRLQYSKMYRVRPEIAKEQVNQFETVKNIMGSLIDG